MRSQWLVLLALAFTTACAPAAPAQPTAAPAKAADPAAAKPAAGAPKSAEGNIKLGVLLPFSGAVAYPGGAARQGFELAFDEAKYQAGGRTIEVFFEDTAADPDTAVTKARRLVEETKVHILIGPFLDHEGLAVQQYTKDKGIPTIVPMSGAEARTLDFPQSVNFQNTDKQPTMPLGDYICKKVGKKRAIIAASDYAWGRSVAEAFEKGFTAAGCTVVDRVFAPLGTADYSPYVTKIASQADNADFLWDWVVAEDGMRFHKTYGELGLNKRLPRYSSSDALATGLMYQVGPTVAGTFIFHDWFPEIDNPQSQAFVKKMKERYNVDADWYHASGYHGGQVVTRVLDKVGGRSEDGKAFLDALLDFQMTDSVLGGNYRFDKQIRAPYLNMYLAEVVEADGKVTRKIVDTIPDVTPKL
jgi:branched-chain amino acid transport system substrate-binding protein